ncbi:hypothetical protein ACO229_03115 [Promicromonospora sp. MS192]|uniref:hypothetical protein n=1 Tax=Promicromonospora sp. MS192 TaxID=3412684 RepID=UPI003C2B9784
MRAEVAHLQGALADTRAGRNADDSGDLTGYLAGLAHCCALFAANDLPDRPRVLWNLYPGAEAGLPNPDTIYRYVIVSPDYRYEITGRRGTSADLTFQVDDSGPERAGRLNRNLGLLAASDLAVRPDGTFTITVGPDEADGRPNHLRLPSDARRIMVRDTVSDWTQTATSLAVRRVGGGPVQPEPGLDELAERAAGFLASAAPLWVKIPEQYNYVLPPNTLPEARPTGAGGLQNQYVTTGTFSLTDDEALVVTAAPGTASYLGFQLGSNWYVDYDYRNHTSSLTSEQATTNPDGSFTWVIALRDPGHANWLDPADHHQGLTLMRWQGLSAPLPSSASPRVARVRLAELRSSVPEGSPFVSAAERQRSAARRRQQYDARMARLRHP